MSDHNALLAAVIKQPDEDSTRLVYADFLDEIGGEANTARAEFIRLQIDSARRPRTDPLRPGLLAREKELADRWAWEWASPLHGHISEWVFCRGFIEKVSTGLECTAEEIRSTLRLAPIRHIREESQLTELKGIVKALPDLARLTGLEFWGLYAFDDELMRELLISPWLAKLRTLILFHDRNGNLVKEDVLVDGLMSPHRANLRYLGVNIDDCWRGPSTKILRAMTESRHLRRVRKLKLSHTRLDPELVAKLFHAMPRLNRLDLHDCVATPMAWNLFVHRAQAGQFKWLRLCGARVSERATQRTDDSGSALTSFPELREAFEAAPVRIDWDTDWILPTIAGCWQGYTWGDQRTREEAHFDRFLRTRDFDGLESYYRDLCRRFRGDPVIAEIDAVPLAKYSNEVAECLRQLSIPEGARAILLRVHDYAGSEAEGYITTLDAGEDFCPHEQRFGGEILGQFRGPSYPGGPERLGGGETNPLDPWSAPLFMRARKAAAVARAAARAALPIPLILAPHHHRVW